MVQGIKGLGWFLFGVVIAPACYMVTTWGAAERAQLRSLEAKIVAARKEIRGLETEFTARANMAQLQQWNGEAPTLQLAAPAPQQYLASETQLASLDSIESQPVQMAALVVPAAPPQAQPAVLTGDGPLKEHDAARVTASGGGIAKARAVAVAMVDRDVLLSPDMEKELRQLAAAEQSKLR